MSIVCGETSKGCNSYQNEDSDDLTTSTLSRLKIDDEKLKKLPRSKGEIRAAGQSKSGLTHECGVFGCIAAGDWPSQIDVPQVICLGEFFFYILLILKKKNKKIFFL